MKKQSKQVKPKNKEAKKYSATFELPGETIKVQADTILECIDALKPKVIKSAGLLTVNEGKKSFAKEIYPRIIRRMIVNRIYRQILAKQFTIALQ